VAPEARGRGVGRALIEAATRHALVHRSIVLAEIRPGNAPSTRAFVAAGYRRIHDGMHEVDGDFVAVERYVARRG
jgi:GNAT superfamily N-acetyltransferase